MSEKNILLEMKDITKEFPGVKALSGVSFKVKKKEIHALVGENGAGKSTLMKILSGVYPYGAYSGDIIFDGALCRFSDIKQSERAGIAIIHQELALSPYLSIAENIFLGHERAKAGMIDWDKTRADALVYMQKLGLNENPDTPVNKLGVGKQQIVEIAKALAKDVKLLILDEPTAALNERDSQNLLKLLTELKNNHGISCVLITHKLNEVSAVADTVTVLRDGRTIETIEVNKAGISEEKIIKSMVGREITDMFPKRSHKPGDTVFEVKNWTVFHPENPQRKILDDINFSVRAGEVVGFAGLMGSGRTELATSLFGKYYGRNISGKTFMEGKEVNLDTIPKAIKHGLAYVTEDRKEYGLVLMQNIKNNTSMANLKAVADYGVINESGETKTAKEFKEKMNIKAPSIYQTAENLSGGNQQKVVLSKWIFAAPKVLILDEPTRGIDVGAKYEIYTIINELARGGMACVLISSEMPEVIGMSDRIYVMSEGRISAELDAKTATQEKIISHMI
ncbi:MAG: ATP-binding cassette domain-containing protein [Elusimicrobia bacterium]|nr:ATP-binding cassette domain-containing protein [Elusimicrobiota bacterium]